MQTPKNLDSELAACTSATPIDVTDTEAHARLSSAALAMCAAVDAVARGERDEAVKRLSSAMLETASALRENGLDLHEVLPHEVCSGCGRQTVEFRRVRGAVECSFCTAESGSSAHDSCDQPGCESYVGIRQQERHVRVEVRGHGPGALPAVTLISPESARQLAHRLHLVGLACEGHVPPAANGRSTLIEMRSEEAGRKVRIRMSGGTPMPFDATFATDDAEGFARAVLDTVAKARRERVMQ